MLILGGTASEREAVGLAFHRESGLRMGPFVGLDCSADEAQLAVALEWWLARSRRPDGPNPLWAAERGTLFLDRIDSLRPATQRLLLELVSRPGPAALRGAEGWAGRLAAGCAADLEDAVCDGRFMADLYDGLDKIRVDLGATHQGGAA